MKKFSTLQIDNKIINQYLFYKNLEINRRYSSSKKKNKKNWSLSMVASRTKT